MHNMQHSFETGNIAAVPIDQARLTLPSWRSQRHPMHPAPSVCYVAARALFGGRPKTMSHVLQNALAQNVHTRGLQFGISRQIGLFVFFLSGRLQNWGN